ncbi:MAG: class I SAM-dependent RNA methyltransferase [Candidatus Krumholzibacteriota bacterium]|nr:class I SAM-dependent RNA methyltransferase [Candidatus Krumholzibacteriota bacterium]
MSDKDYLNSQGSTEIKKIVYGGLGLAHFEGKTLFIPYTAPGDIVEFNITEAKKKVLFGEILNITTPSPDRVTPRCPIFGRCGGCHLLHLDYDSELKVKRESVAENLSRIGKISMELDAMTASPSREGYRNHAVFWFDDDCRPGFRMKGSRTVVPFPDEGCLLLPVKVREEISSLPASSRFPGAEVRVRLDRYENVHFHGLKGDSGAPDILMEAGGYNYPISSDGFFQVNRLLNDKLIETVLSLPRKAVRKIVDLYCGTGFFTLPLSRISEEVIGIERDPQAVKNASAALKLNKIENVRFRKGKAEEEIHRIREADLLIADPPRSGIPDSAMNGIIKLRPEEIIIVSCEPPTFSRDTGKLIEAGYILSSIDLIDMFPGTYHTETVGMLKRS